MRNRGPDNPVDPTLVMLTCSMARDLDLFALLAESVDRHVDDRVKHMVVVPGQQTGAFRRFENARRTVVAQEDMLPLRVWKTPDALKHLAFIRKGFRRPVYFDRRLRSVRGWMLQQLIKLQFSRQAVETAVMHCDSDMAFVRTMPMMHAFPGGKPLFFRVHPSHQKIAGDHRRWLGTAASLLGAQLPTEFGGNYVENGIVWSTNAARGMAERIESVTGSALHEAILTHPTISEYYLYGVYLDLVAGTDAVTPAAFPICRSLWSVRDGETMSAEAAASRMRPGDVAVAIQSTVDLSIEARQTFLHGLEAVLTSR